MEKVTLKQIAEMAGVSLTTVHRVLNGKGGTSKKVEENILRIAKEQGYAINVAASNLRKQPLHIALVFPRMDKGAHYFVNRILDGYLAFRQEVSQFNVVFQEFYIQAVPGNLTEAEIAAASDLERILKMIYREQPMRYDGVVIYGLSITPRAEALLNRIVGSGTVVIINQQLSEGDPNGKACAECLQNFRPDLKAVQIPLALEVNQSTEISRVLRKYCDIQAVYSTSARHTNSLLKALNKEKLQLQAVIGSELFEESYHALHDRTLSAVIDKRPEQIGYKGLQLLFGALTRKEDLPTIHRVTPRIILRANSDIYYVEKENLYGKTRYPE